MNCKYVDWSVFENLPSKSYEITSTKYDDKGTKFIKSTEKSIKKFICQAPIGSGKSTALRKWIYNTVPNNKFILIVPTINIAMEFYSKLFVALNNKYPNSVDELIKACVKEGAFKEFKQAIISFIPVVITTFSTASKCLCGIIEHFFHHNINFNDQYTLLIDEAHLLLEHISLIEICREFDNVGLITATATDISCLSVFSEYDKINPLVGIKYDRTIYLYKLKSNMEEQRETIAKQVMEEIKNYDKILIKIEDKNECEKIKECIDNELNKALYNSDKKEVEISSEGKFVNPEDVDIIIATSCIQSGQSLKEKLLSIFIQTPLDTVSSVEQFVGRNRNDESTAYLYMRQLKVPEEKFTYKIAKNRYKTRLNQLRANAWMSMNQESWVRCLNKIGNVIVEDIDEELETTTLEVDADDLNKEFNGKKELYKYFGFKNEKEIPYEYEIRSRFTRVNGKKQRVYKLVKVE